MNNNYNHNCIICGSAYHYCDDCSNIKSFTPWRTICDTPEHYQIYMTMHDLDNKSITKNEAKLQLKNIGITDEHILILKQSVRDIINEILSDDNVSHIENKIKPSLPVKKSK